MPEGAYCQNDPVNYVDVLGMFKTQVQADEFRTRMLLAQIIEDPTRIPTEPSKEISNGDFFPYLPNVEEFGVFKPYTQADYDRAKVEIEKITTANMSGGSIYPISEQQANDMAWASAGGEWNPSATAALTLGAANTQFNANINSGFLLPVGGAGFALKGLQGTRALTALNTAAPLLKNASLGNLTYHSTFRSLNSGAVTSNLAKVLAPKTTGNTTALTKYWPDNNGFTGKTSEAFLYKGQKIDRYGGGDWSRFFSPQGTPDFARALPPGTAGQPLRTFEVMKPFPVQSGQVAPAFGQMGGGTQMVSPVNLKTLLDKGVLKEVTR